MDINKWYEAGEGKRLEAIKVVITKQYLDPYTNQLTDHNIVYDIPTHQQEYLAEIIFSDLQHKTEEEVARMRYKLDARYRRSVEHLNRLHRYC